MGKLENIIDANARKLKEFELREQNGQSDGKPLLLAKTRFESKRMGRLDDLAHISFGIPEEKIRKSNPKIKRTEELLNMFEKLKDHVGKDYFKASAILAHILTDGNHDGKTANRLLFSLRTARNRFGFNQNQVLQTGEFYLGRGRLISHLNLIRKIYELSDENTSHTHGIIDKEVQRAFRTKMFDRH